MSAHSRIRTTKLCVPRQRPGYGRCRARPPIHDKSLRRSARHAHQRLRTHIIFRTMGDRDSRQHSHTTRRLAHEQSSRAFRLLRLETGFCLARQRKGIAHQDAKPTYQRMCTQVFSSPFPLSANWWAKPFHGLV